MTTVLPAAMAGAIFHAAIWIGKFQGVMAAHTPTGSYRTQLVEPGLRGSARSSSSRAASSANTRNVEITIPMSAPFDIRMVWPASRASSSASPPAFCLTRSATLSIS
jgi:hypothetical protein